MSFVSDLANTLVIGDHNADLLLRSPHRTGYEARDWSAEPFGSNGFAVPMNLPLIAENEWRPRIEELERTGSLLSQLARQAGMKSKDQKQTNYCWANGTVRAVELVEVRQGRPYTELSPASVAGPITNYRNVGGWGTKALAKIVADGAAPVANWPANGIDRRYDNDASQAARQSHKITQWADVEPRNFAALMTCLLMGLPCPVAYQWWGHLVCAVDPAALPSGFGVRIWNSWGETWGDQGMAVLTGHKALPDEAICPLVVLA